MGVVELQGVSRTFGELVAVDDVRLHVDEGEIVGLLGHNGAGKTTILRVLNGLLPADTGTVRVHGLDPMVHGEQVRSRTGVLTEYPALEAYLSPRENLELHAAIHGLKGRTARSRIDALLDRLGLAAKANTPARDLSAGLRQRVALARAFVHAPPLLLLDEPTTNMDPVAARDVRQLVRDAVVDGGSTVLLSTHNLTEAEDLCDRVAIMRGGKILSEGPPQALRRSMSPAHQVEITTSPDAVPRVLERLADRWDVQHVGEGHLVVSGFDPDAVEDETAAVVATFVSAWAPVFRVEPQEATMEDLYVAMHTGRPPNDEPIGG